MLDLKIKGLLEFKERQQEVLEVFYKELKQAVIPHDKLDFTEEESNETISISVYDEVLRVALGRVSMERLII